MYVGLVAGFLLGFIIARSLRGRTFGDFSRSEVLAFGKEGRRVQKERAERRKERILALAKEKGKIVNDDAEDLFCISDSTANRYLRELVSEGKLEKHGENRNTFYTPKEKPLDR